MLEKLQKSVKSCSTLEELVTCFFDTVGEADGEIEYVGGELPAIFMQPGCKLLLQYSKELEDGEFYQLNMDVELNADGEKFPYDHKLYDKSDGDLKEYILGSKVFEMLKDKAIIRVVVYDGET